jgi:hypothetical protein
MPWSSSSNPTASSSILVLRTLADDNRTRKPLRVETNVGASLLARPLHLPELRSDGSCPVTTRWVSYQRSGIPPADFGIGRQLGSGPVYPGAMGGRAWYRHTIVQMASPRQPDVPMARGWLVEKV